MVNMWSNVVQVPFRGYKTSKQARGLYGIVYCFSMKGVQRPRAQRGVCKLAEAGRGGVLMFQRV